MFRWLRRRLDREHCKLIYQNFAAATDSELRTYMLFNGEDTMPLDAIVLITNEQRHRMRAGQRLTNEDVDRALTINKDLRRFHDHNHHPDRGGFDQTYAPLGGWKMYFEDNGTVP
ncbi:MAG TPA: hypothetical protein VK614_15005 [Allosphingosinicella sp.]|nr:hypothetical protein [Allosphingosinicella sp.]